MATTDNDNVNPDRRVELVEVAAAVINQRGMESTRLSDVAAAANVSVGLLQHYFGTRDVLMREAFEVAVVGDFEDQLESHRSTDDPWQRIVLVLTELISPAEPCKEARNWLNLCAAAARDTDLQPTVSEVQKRWVLLIQHAIEDGAERGIFKPAHPAHEIAETINALADGMVLNLALDFSENGEINAEAMRTSAEETARLLVGATIPAGKTG